MKKLKNLIALIASAIKWLWGYETAPLRADVIHPADPKSGVAQHLQQTLEPPVVLNVMAALSEKPAGEAWRAVWLLPGMEGFASHRQEEKGHE